MSVRNEEALRLFRQIQRLHRLLPEEFRILGSAYARDEFKRHSTAKPEFIPAFMQGWREYAQVIQQQVDTRARKLGKVIDPALSRGLTDEQVGQLYELRSEAKKPRLQ